MKRPCTSSASNERRVPNRPSRVSSSSWGERASRQDGFRRWLGRGARFISLRSFRENMKPQDWLEYGQRHLKSARILLEAGALEDALFWAHQAVEVALKGAILLRTGHAPPRIHSLRNLARSAGWKTINDFVVFGAVYVTSRYPGVGKVTAGRREVRRAFQLAEEVLSWFKYQLK